MMTFEGMVAIVTGGSSGIDAALGLGAAGGDVGDAELREGAAELGWLPLARELFFH